MHRSRLSTFVIDCKGQDIEAAAKFWGKALGREIKPPQADSPTYRELTTPNSEPLVLVQTVDHDSRIHLDVESDDLEAEVKRLQALGAKRIGFVKRWFVMEAPTGQRFCVVNPQRDKLTDAIANRWD
ncbi:MAG: VOC family protein [Myxococcaceae bacterium]